MAFDKNGKVLPKGITYRKNENRYMGRFMYHGKPYTTYGKTAKEAVKNLEELKYKVEHDIYFKDSSVTFNVWFDIWIEQYKSPVVKSGTVGVYQQNYNAYIKHVFGNKQLRDIRTDHIQAFYNNMATKYSLNTLEICRAILNGMYAQAVRNEIIQKNPVSNAVLPRKRIERPDNVLSMSDQRLFLQYAKGTRHYPIYELALSTGMRSGELRGLQWTDIDFQEKIIHVTHTLVYYNGEYILDSPKTLSSKRDIPMLNNVSQLLRQQKKDQLEERLMMGPLWSPPKGFESLVFTNAEGHPINRDRFKRCIDKITKKIQKEDILFPHVTPHTFRHTFATRSLEHGMNPKTLQAILGHSDFSTTMDTYAHVLPDTKAIELEKIAGLFA